MRKYIIATLVTLVTILCTGVTVLAVSFNMGGEESQESNENYSVSTLSTANVVDSGTCGADDGVSNISWTLYDDGILEIHGTGTLYNYSSSSSVPWYGYVDDITEVSISEGITKIDGYGITCLKVTELHIPEGVCSYYGARNRISSYLKDIYLPSTFTQSYSGNCALATSNNLYIHVDENNQYFCDVGGALYSKDKTKLWYYTLSDREPNYIIPEGTIEMADAFYESHIQSITIPKSLVIIEDYNDETDGNKWYSQHNDYGRYSSWGPGISLRYSNIANIEVDSENPAFTSIDGVLYSKDMTDLILYPRLKTGTEYLIPETVTAICAGAFDRSRSLSSVTLPNNLKKIGRTAFDETKIEEFILPEGVTHIHGSGLYTSNLKHVVIPASVKYIDSLGCNGLKTAGPIGGGYDLEFGWTNELPKNAFCYCTTLESIEIPSSITKIGDYAFSNTGLAGDFIIPDGVTSIGDSAFNACSNITNIGIPDSVNSIGSFAFARCTNLENISIPDSVTSIKHYTFYECKSLKSIDISNNVTGIDYNAFDGCTNLTSITIPNSVKGVGYHAFNNCTNLYNINIDRVGGTLQGVLGGSNISPTVTWLRTLNVSSDNAIYKPTGVTPAVKVVEYKGETLIGTLTNNTDYTVSYSNNISAGTGNYIVSFTGDYTGASRYTGTFIISPKNSSALDIASISNQTYTGSEIKPEPTVTDPDI